MNERSDASPPPEKVLVNPPSPPLSIPPLGTISPDFDSRVDIYLGRPLSFDGLAGVNEGQYYFGGFVESNKSVSADCSLVKVRGPLRHQASTKITFRDGHSGKIVYDGPLARAIDLVAGQDGLLCLFRNVRAVAQVQPRNDLCEIAAPEVVSS